MTTPGHRALALAVAALGALALAPTGDSAVIHFYASPAQTVLLKAAPSPCTADAPHHSSTVTVADYAAGGAVEFTVSSDWPRIGLESTFPCGDGVAEACDPADPTEIPDVTCNSRDQSITFPPQVVGSTDNVGTVPFGPGIDGNYHVQVSGAFGAMTT